MTKDQTTARKAARQLKAATREPVTQPTPKVPVDTFKGTAKGMGAATKGGKFVLW